MIYYSRLADMKKYIRWQSSAPGYIRRVKISNRATRESRWRCT